MSTQTLPTGGSGSPDPIGPLVAWRAVINGQAFDRQIPVTATLLDVLRDHCCLTGTKGACLEGECGSCTVLLDGEPVNSCLVLAMQVQDRQITTIEGLAHEGRLHVLQQKFVEAGAAQCGYCTPGLIMSAAAFLQRYPDPTADEFFENMEGNICRCTGYKSICQAIRAAAEECGNLLPQPGHSSFVIGPSSWAVGDAQSTKDK